MSDSLWSEESTSQRTSSPEIRPSIASGDTSPKMGWLLGEETVHFPKR